MNEGRQYDNVFQNWRVKRLIGSGSYGRVYEMERVEGDAVYRSAMKAITIPQNDSEIKSRLAEGQDVASVTAYYKDVAQSLLNENRVMAELKGNSNIVSYEDHQIIQHEDGIGCDILIRMELLTSFIDYMSANAMTEETVIRLGIDICKALELCERKKIIHRDIKPGNIFVSDAGDFKLGDFGIARTIERTTSGLSKKGTYRYMAPEVYRGDDYGKSVDLYSLGLVMYYLMNRNRTPFLPPPPQPISFTEEETALARRMRGEQIPPPAQASPGLASIIRKACAYQEKDRYSSAGQMREALEQLQSGMQGKTASQDPEATVADRMQSGPQPFAAAVAAPVAPRPQPGSKPKRKVKPAGSRPQPPAARWPQPQPQNMQRPQSMPARGHQRPRAMARQGGTATGGTNRRQNKTVLIIVIAAAAVFLIVAAVAVTLLVTGSRQPQPQETTVATQETEPTASEEEMEEIADEEAASHVIAHRQTGEDVNCIESYGKAIDQGAQYIEQDVVLADDGVLYVSYNVLPSDQLEAQGNPPLWEVFDQFEDSVTYVVELKSRNEDTVRALIDLISEYGIEDNVIVQCFEGWILEEIKAEYPDMLTMLLCDNNNERDGQSALENALTQDYIDIIAVSYEDGLMNRANCDMVHEEGKEFCAWVLDSDKAIERAISLDVDRYFTHYPARAIDLEKTDRYTY